MADAARRLPSNVDGPLFVDETCIDCHTCRWMAPATFARRDEQSYVHAQPEDDADVERALMALVACPTASIGTSRTHRPKGVLARFPDPIDVDADGRGAYHTGFHAEASFGATSYLLVRDAGNVLVDSPRYHAGLARRIEELGGVDLLFLTHRDDVADHARWAERFGAPRVLHAADRTADTADVERWLEGDEPVALDDGLLAIPVPGHTRGSVCLLADERYLFAGDHVMWSTPRQCVYASRSTCWYDWERQTESMRRLAEQRFEWLLPGHGERCRFPADELRRRLVEVADWMAAGGVLPPLPITT